MFAVTILGNNSALPAYDRHPTSQVVTLEDQVFLVDCGEGTQMQLTKYKVRWGRIQHIFISHLHGDHYFGLPGLINTMGLLNRDQPLHIYAPPLLLPQLDLQFEAAAGRLNYPMHFHPLEKAGVLVEGEKWRVSCFPTQHRIPCFGFKFEEKKAPRKVIADEAIRYEIPAAFYERLKWGEHYNHKTGHIIKNDWVTEAAPLPRSYVYCADTIFDEQLIEVAKDASLLYHETTYLKDLEDRAGLRFHSTTHQAATIALKAGAKQLLIGHFSSKYENIDVFETEAREIFPNTHLALEGATFKV